MRPLSVRIVADRLGARREISAKYLIDATGPRGCLAKHLQIPEKDFADFLATEAIYSHFSNAGRWEDQHRPEKAPPFPVDDAALHHIFPGGWIWVLRFNNGLTSAGAALDPQLALRLNTSNPATAWQGLLNALPSVREQFSAAKAVTSFMHIPKLPFRSSTAVGERWLMLPSSLGFIDPLLSTGFPLNLLGILRLGGAFNEYWGSEKLPEAFRAYERLSFNDLDAAADLISGLYDSFANFESFAALSMFYFAAASFSESALRLDPRRKPGAFLFSDDTVLHKQIHRAQKPADIATLIEPFNIAGLANPSARNWYSARARDLLASHEKLGVSLEAVQEMLDRCGF